MYCFAGTFFLAFVASIPTPDPIAVGAMLLSMVYMGDHLCGVDFNPAVTLGAALRWAVPLSGYWRILLTALSQFAGALSASFMAYAVYGKVGKPSENVSIDETGHLAFEALWSTILVYTVCSVMTSISDDPKDDRQLQRRGIAIGFVVAAGLFSAAQKGNGDIPWTSIFNPAIGTALTVVDASMQNDSAHRLWILFLGPFLGSIFGSGLFSLLHAHKDPVGEDDDLSGTFRKGWI